MGTYNKYTGTPYEAISTPIILDNSATQSYTFVNNSVYSNLLDNTTYIIEPKDLRNAILSLWDSTTFKLTSVNSDAYIGIDSGDTTNNKDIKDKIYFGKRNYKSSEIMDNNLLTSNTDIFLYNTRPDTLISQNKTTISILAGTSTSIYKTAPIIESEIYTHPDSTQALAFNMLNSNGDITILSKGPENEDFGGIVSINNLGFPTYQDSDPSPIFGGTISNNKVLTLHNNNLIWSELSTDFPYYGSTGSILPIYGNPTKINGYDLEFTETMYCPIEIGDINLGQTFNSESIANVLESIIYEYLNPLCTLTLNTPKYLEVGTYPNILLSYTITKRTNNTLPTSLQNMTPSFYPDIISNQSVTISGTANGVAKLPLENTTTEFKIVATDDGFNQNSASTSITGIYPYFYGFSPLSTMTTIGLKNLTKLVDYKSDKTLDITGSGNLYFIYDVDYGPLTIKDKNGIDITSSFTSSIINLSSPTGLWASKQFRVYMKSGVAQIGPPSENFYLYY